MSASGMAVSFESLSSMQVGDSHMDVCWQTLAGRWRRRLPEVSGAIADRIAGVVEGLLRRGHGAYALARVREHRARFGLCVSRCAARRSECSICMLFLTR